MLTLPLIVPRDSHELWFGSSRSHSTSSHQIQNFNNARRNTNNATTFNRPQYPPNSTGESLSALQLEERALRARKQNIAYFGYSWIRPAGCSKTMLGMKEEEAEREEALVAAQQEMAAAAAAAAAAEAAGPGMEEDGEGEEGFSGMERDLDDDIPDADEDAEGLVEEGEEGLEEDGLGDEEGYMERDLDDDIPEAYPDDEDDMENGLEEEFEDDEAQYEDFDNQADLDDEIPSAGDGAGDDDDDDENEYDYDQGEEIMSDQGMARDLDDDIPEAAEEASNQEEEWQHTDTEAEFDDDESFFNPNASLRNSLRNSLRSSFRNSTSSAHGLPQPPSIRRIRGRETEAQRRFLQRWSGGGDSFADSSSMMVDEEDLRASVTSRGSRRSVFGRFSRRTGGPRDSLDG